jgi:phage terminase large subunit-like protein
MTNDIYAYYQQIEDGTIPVGEWVRLAYRYVIHGLESGEFTFDQKKASRAIRFIESFCHHSEGSLAPQLLRLELWQRACVSVIFGILDHNGNRQFREVPIVVGRKNGKTLFLSGIAVYCLFMDGEYGARIFCVAPKLDQADIVYHDIWQTISSEPELMDLIKRRKSDYYVESTNSSVKKIAFNAKKSDGFNPHLVICDEIASWPGDTGLKQYEVMKSAFGARRQPLLLSCSTSGYVNDGIYDELIKRCTRFLKGDSKEKRLFPLLYMIDDIEKWNDINELRKSNPNLGVSVSVDYMLEEIAVAEGSLSKKAEFLTKYCNIKQSSSQAWLKATAVEHACGKPLHLEEFRGSYCVAGVDLSQTTDLTAATIVIEKGGVLYVFAKFWLPPEKLEEATARDGVPYQIYVQRGLLELSGENFVDYHDCYRWLCDMIEQYEIYPLMVGYDRYSAQYLIQDLKTYGFCTDDVYQGDNLYPVLLEMEGLFKDKKICIGDNDLLKLHLLNAAIKMNNERGRGKLVKLSANAHIDGCAALADAFTVRQKYYDQYGIQLQNGA